MENRINEEDESFVQELDILLDTMSDVSNPQEHWSGGSLPSMWARSFISSFFTGGLSMYSLKLTLDPKLYNGKEPFDYENSYDFISSISLKDSQYEYHDGIGIGKTGKERMNAYKAMSHFKLFPDVEVFWDGNLPYFYVESASMVLFFSSTEIDRVLRLMRTHGATKIGYPRFSAEINYKPDGLCFNDGDFWFSDDDKPVFLNIGVFEFLKPFKLY
jgi:hypothetical protein